VYSIGMEEREIESIEVDPRDADKIPFDEGDTVILQDEPATGAYLISETHSMTGKLHSDEKTFVAFSVVDVTRFGRSRFDPRVILK